MKKRPGALIKVAVRNIKRNGRRSLAALLSIAAGFAALNLFQGYISDAENMFEVTYSHRLMLGDLLIHKELAFKNGALADDPDEQLSPNDQTKIEKILQQTGQTENVVRFFNLSGLISNGSTNLVFIGYGYDLRRGREMRAPSWVWNTLAGTPLENNPDTVQLGRGLGRVLGCTLKGDAPPLTPAGGYDPVNRPFACHQPKIQLSVTTPAGQMNAETYSVSSLIDSVYREVDMRNVVLSLEHAQQLMGNTNITYYAARTKSGISGKDICRQLNKTFRDQNLPFIATEWKKHAFGEIFVQSMEFLGVFRSFTILVVLAIVVLSVLSTLIRLVQERTREIGTLRSLGFRPRLILGLFLAEVVLLAMLGNFVGAVISLVTAGLLNQLRVLYQIGILSERVPFHITLPVANFMYAATILTLLACAAGALATMRALRASIPDCLGNH